jgi:hypothetical protein
MWKAFLMVDCQILDILDQEIVLDAGTGDANRVAFLEGILTDILGRHLASDDHHRDGIHVGGGDAGNRIGHPGPEVTKATPTFCDERE